MARDRRPATAAVRPGPGVGWAVALGAGVLALVVRWRLLGGAAGLRGYHGYDDGVYFSSAVALVHGRLPYRDFLLLHPPGITLALTPFAALTHWTSDATALAVARVGFLLVGAANTVLVARLARRWGLAAAVVGGALYAVSTAAASTERLTLLEPLGTLTLLAGVTLLLRGDGPGSARRWWYVGGAVLGLGVVVKIWNVVPVLVVVVWWALRRGPRAALGIAASAAAAALLVVLPFALASGRTMLDLVVLAQLGRARGPGTAVDRLQSILGVSATQWTSEPVRVALTAVVVLAVIAAAVAAWRQDRGRLWVAVLCAQVLVLLAAPPFFASYAAYSAAAVALVLAAGVSTVPGRARPWGAVAVCGLLGVVAGVPAAPSQAPFPVAQVRDLLPATGCVHADSPGALAVLDVLSRNERRGCATRIDVTGQTYIVGQHDSNGRTVPRARNQRWQDDAVAYLTSGSAAVIAREAGNGLAPTTFERLRSHGRIVQVGKVEVLLLPASSDG